jgi:hypothetical protein
MAEKLYSNIDYNCKKIKKKSVERGRDKKSRLLPFIWTSLKRNTFF